MFCGDISKNERFQKIVLSEWAVVVSGILFVLRCVAHVHGAYALNKKQSNLLRPDVGCSGIAIHVQLIRLNKV